MIKPDHPEKKPNGLLFQYAALAAQLAAGLLLTVYLGLWLDKWVHFAIPVFIWLLPLLLVIGMMIKAIRDTTKK